VVLKHNKNFNLRNVNCNYFCLFFFSDFYSDIQEHHTKFPYAWVVGSMAVALVVIVLSILLLFLCKYFNSHLRDSENHSKVPNQPVSHKFQLLKSSSFLYGSRRYLCCSFGDLKQPRDDAANHHIDIPSGQLLISLSF
jgi:hypothetical protein